MTIEVTESYLDVIDPDVVTKQGTALDYLDVVDDGEVTVIPIGGSALEMRGNDVLQTEVSKVNVLEFTTGAFTTGGSVSDGATEAKKENDGYIYVGRETTGNAMAATPTWQIYRVPDTDPGQAPQYADGNKNFDNVWGDRKTLTYS